MSYSELFHIPTHCHPVSAATSTMSYYLQHPCTVVVPACRKFVIL